MGRLVGGVGGYITKYCINLDLNGIIQFRICGDIPSYGGLMGGLMGWLMGVVRSNQ